MKGRTGRPAGNQDTQLTRERIVEAALRISDNEPDLSGLTVRRLAGELGVGTTITVVFPQEADRSVVVSAADEPASVLISERRRRTSPYLAINELVQTEIADRVHPEHEVQDSQAGDVTYAS